MADGNEETTARADSIPVRAETNLLRLSQGKRPLCPEVGNPTAEAATGQAAGTVMAVPEEKDRAMQAVTEEVVRAVTEASAVPAAMAGAVRAVMAADTETPAAADDKGR